MLTHLTTLELIGATSMIIYLYVKQHSITKLKYFGKTNRTDPFKYSGSGKIWLNHIKKHGIPHVKTLEVWGFDDKQLCTEFAIKFSKENNIVESSEWANLIEENGLDGWPIGKTNPSKRIENILRMKHKNPMTILRENNGTFKTGSKPIITPERNELIRKSKLAERNHNYKNPIAAAHLNANKSACIHCGIRSTIGNISRWHNDKCKHKS